MPETTNNPNLLKDTREAKGITLDIVHEATKIPLDALKAIEQGYSVRSLTPFYHRGFVKIYAEFLGLDPKEVFRARGMEQAPAPIVVSAPAKRAAVPMPKAGTAPNTSKKILQPDPVWENTQEGLGRLWAPKNRRLVLRALAIIFAIWMIFKVGGCVVNNLSHSKPAVKRSAVKAAKEPKAQRQPVEQAIAAPTPAPVIKVQSADHRVQLVVRAIRKNCVQVKVDGKVAFSMTMAKGTVESWSAREVIELSGKNLNELELEINGQNIGQLGSEQRGARRVVITKDGLTVKK